MSEMLSGLLNSPEGMEKIKNLAGTLLGGSSPEAEPVSPPKPKTPDLSGLFGDVSPSEIAGIMKVFSALKSGANDNRTNLLMSLKPHLSDKRQQRVDEAVKILRLVSVLPAIKGTGIL